MKLQDEIQQFEKFWREMETQPRQGLFVHPQDAPLVKPGTPGSTGELQLQVPPIPANGSIRHADVVLFMLNPNFDAGKDAVWRKDYPASARVLDGCVAANLHQLHAPGDRAFYDVRSDLKDSPGANYWKKGGGFAEIAEAMAEERGYLLDDAYDEIARRVVVLQLVPYRSKTFRNDDLIAAAPSSAHAHRLAHFLAQNTDKLLVVQRKINAWGFSHPDARPNVVVYPTNLALSASLGFQGGPGGLPILNRLLGKPSGTPLPIALSAPSRKASAKVVGPAPAQPARAPAASIDAARPLPAPIGAPVMAPAAAHVPGSWPPDRTEELRSIYEASGLSQSLTSNGLNPPGKEPFSKLKFVMPNDFRLSSIELYELRNGERYLRIHHARDAPAWLIAELRSWDGLRSMNSTGVNFTLDSSEIQPLAYAKALAQLLQRHA